MSIDPTPTPATPPEPPHQRRSLGTWLLLLAVWTAGLLSWALYLIAAVYLLTRVL